MTPQKVMSRTLHQSWIHLERRVMCYRKRAPQPSPGHTVLRSFAFPLKHSSSYPGRNLSWVRSKVIAPVTQTRFFTLRKQVCHQFRMNLVLMEMQKPTALNWRQGVKSARFCGKTQVDTASPESWGPSATPFSQQRPMLQPALQRNWISIAFENIPDSHSQFL